MGMGDLLPIIVFAAVLVIGLMWMKSSNRSRKKTKTGADVSYHDMSAKTQSQNKSRHISGNAPQSRTQDTRIHTSWGYTFPENYEFKPENTRSERELLADFKRLIAANFRDYQVYVQVPASELDNNAHPACHPISFLFEKEDELKLAIFIVRENNYRGHNVVGTEAICREQGIRYIRFIVEYANDDDYVVARIRHYLS